MEKKCKMPINLVDIEVLILYNIHILWRNRSFGGITDEILRSNQKT